MNSFVKTAVVISALALPVIFFWHDIQTIATSKGVSIAAAEAPRQEKEKKKKGKEEKNNQEHIGIKELWELPAVLKEVSGIAYLGNNLFACIQDELGAILIYNSATEKIEKQIPFAGSGDYEGVAITGTTAWVVRADGKLFEITNYNSSPVTKQHSTPLTVLHNVEGLCYDKNNNRLLLAIKDAEPQSQDYKGIYAFDLEQKKLNATPVYKIDLTHDIWENTKEKKATSIMQPSDINIHPATGDIYVTDGANPKLLIMDNKGNNKRLIELNKKDFEQPEGITFSPEGDVYLSSEGGKKGKGIIASVSIK